MTEVRIEDRLNGFLASGAFSPEAWTSPAGRCATIGQLFVIARSSDVTTPEAHRLVAELIKSVLGNQDPEFVDRDTAGYLRALKRYHSFSADPLSPQSHSLVLCDRVEETYQERSGYSEVPFGTIYESFKHNPGDAQRNLGLMLDSTLLSHLAIRNGARILDLAVGGGHEMLQLLSHGWNVEGNDVDPQFIEEARKRVATLGRPSIIHHSDWRELSRSFSPGSYQAAYLIGNSLAYLHDQNDQQTTLRQISEILQPGGLLLVDSRHYDRILDLREHILADPIRNFQFMYMQHYTGDESVFSHPISISDENVRIEYLAPELRQRAYLDLYPFREAELEALFTESGFDIVDRRDDSDINLTERRGYHDFTVWVLRNRSK